MNLGNICFWLVGVTAALGFSGVLALGSFYVIVHIMRNIKEELKGKDTW